MLEAIDFTDKKLTKADYKERYDELVARLIVLQQNAKAAGVGLVVLFEGWNGAGKGSRMSDLLYELDARATHVHVTEDPNAETVRRFRRDNLGATDYFPVMQEFWQALGPRGDMTFFDRGWYSTVSQHLIMGDSDKKPFTAFKKKNRGQLVESAMDYRDSIESFERQLTDDGYIVVKFFLHISKEVQQKRLTKLAQDPATQWRVTQSDLDWIDYYSRIYPLYDSLLENTNFDYAPWQVLNAEDKRSVNLRVVQTLVDVLEHRLNRKADPAELQAAKKAAENSASQGDEEAYRTERERTPEENETLLARAEEIAAEQHSHAPVRSRFDTGSRPIELTMVDHGLKLDRETYKRRLKEEQNRFNTLELELYKKRIPMILMYEGWDAAGKGGNIKRVAKALDARAYTIFPSPAPTKPELLHPFLWRYWIRLPKAGHVGIYDRSWYGRVLVERVEGFASYSEWSRAYDEINEFERELCNWGAILLKFWVDITPEEQLARFEARENNPAKQWKITGEDWRNRDKFPQYREAVKDMLRLTSTSFAPWTILESNDKYYARVEALKIINDALETRLREL